jgi:hypothetical protein
MPQRAAAALPGLNLAQGVVLARVEQGREQAEALPNLEAALEAAEAAPGEADHRIAQQNSRSSRCATNK